ncbi:SCO3933 family regulatory protein [Streptomyces niveus]
MQNIPVDVGRLGSLMCVVPPEPRLNPETQQVRTDRDGNPVWVVGVSVRQQQTRRADVIEVAIPGEPTGIAEGMRVQLVDLVAVAWEIEGRKGTSFRASSIAPETAGRPVASTPSSRPKASGQGAEA